MPPTNLILDLMIRYGFQVLGAFVILGVGLVTAWWVGNLARQPLERVALEPPVKKLIVRSVRIVILVFALMVALDKFGFQIAPLVAGIGVAGLGIGIALQGVLSNVMAGLTIIFTKPFRVGEHVEIAGVRGDVAAIELFSTTLLHPDRSRVVIPNRKIVGDILHNFGTMRQLHLTVTVPHGANLSAVLAAAWDVVSAHPRVLKDPAPVVGITEVGGTGIKIGVQPWVQVVDVGVAESEFYRALVESFRAREISVPLPRQEIRLLNAPPAAATAVA